MLKRRLKQLSKPWITKGTSIKIKNKLYASGDPIKYKCYRNKLNTLIRSSKKEYYSTYFENNIANMKKTWEGINTLLQRRTKSSKQLSSLKDPNTHKISKDPLRVSNILNNHFASIGPHLADKLPPIQQSFTDFLTKSKSPQSSFLFRPVTAAEIQLEIMSIPNNKAYGLYSCPTQLLKCVSNIISQPLASLLNFSVTQGTKDVKNSSSL